LSHRHRLGLPERERVDGAGGPAPARLAMTKSRALGFARDLDGDRTALALPLVGLVTHQLSPRSKSGRSNCCRAVSPQAATRPACGAAPGPGSRTAPR